MKIITFLAIVATFLYLSQFLYEDEEKGEELSILEKEKGNLLRFNCHYSILWCGCYSKTTAEITGCQVSCSPSYSHSIYNTTSCPQYKQYFLSGFHLT